VHGQLIADPTQVEQQKAQQKAAKVKAMQSSGSPVKEDVNTQFDNLFEDLRQWFSKSHPEGGWKRINSKGEAIGPCAREPGEPKPKCMSNEKRAQLSKKERASAVAAKRKHDPEADRSGKGGKPVNVSNFGKGKISESESYTGTNRVKHTDGNHYVASAGKPRVYIIRNNAAKDAHRNNGEIVKVDRGYMVKLKENNNATIFQGSIVEKAERTYSITSSGWSDTQGTITVPAGSGTVTISETRTTRTDSSTGTSAINEHCGSPEAHIGDGSEYDPTEEKSRTKGKITLNKIKENFKQKVSESIDKGIEPGISMAGAGESIGRDMGEKNNKKGKVTVVKEMGGDETTASIGDQKEDELKKQGISLSTFKKKNYL
jgi:hypothetical protein